MHWVVSVGAETHCIWTFNWFTKVKRYKKQISHHQPVFSFRVVYVNLMKKAGLNAWLSWLIYKLNHWANIRASVYILLFAIETKNTGFPAGANQWWPLFELSFPLIIISICLRSCTVYLAAYAINQVLRALHEFDLSMELALITTYL